MRATPVSEPGHRAAHIVSLPYKPSDRSQVYKPNLECKPLTTFPPPRRAGQTIYCLIGTGTATGRADSGGGA